MKNAVLQKGALLSTNYYISDLSFKHFFQTYFSATLQQELEGRLQKIGAQAANEMISLSLTADKNPPKHIKRDFYGEPLDTIEYHPAYTQMLQMALDTGMFRLKWEPELRKKFQKERHIAGFAGGFFYAMAELSQYCPLCMTDGVARVIDLWGTKEDKNRLLPSIYTYTLAELRTGAMFLTEKTGGSDVGANIVSATPIQGEWYALQGEKWFCSNAGADIIFALARTRPDLPSTKGLGIFLVEPQLPDGSKNPMDLVRLKDKLGTRSMPSGEYIFQQTQAKLVGSETEGFRIMTEMLNLSRLYNALAAVAGMRRALIEVWQYLNQRTAFGKPVIEHALARRTLAELCAVYHSQFYLTWHTIRLLDWADNGDKDAQRRLRFLTPLIKRSTAIKGVWLVRECMELMGGIGYIEDGIMPRLMRDMMVLPIWEGTGNIMILDMLRAETKYQCLESITSEIGVSIHSEEYDFQAILQESNLELKELKSFDYFEYITEKLSQEYMRYYRDEHSKQWIDVALLHFPTKNKKHSNPISVEELHQLMAFVIV